MGEMRWQHVVWQGRGSDGRNVEVVVTQTPDRVRLRKETRDFCIFNLTDCSNGTHVAIRNKHETTKPLKHEMSCNNILTTICIYQTNYL